MSKRLPEFIEPLRLAEQNRRLEGQIALAKMKRLASSLVDSKGDAEVNLEFGVDDAGQANIRGKVAADLHMQCQRCMQAMVYSVDSKVSLAMVYSETQAEQLPDRYEPLMLDDSIDGKDVSLTALVEDELILALPTVAMHEVNECPAGDKFQSTSHKESDTSQPEGLANKKANPFAVLAKLKDKSKQ